MMNWRQREPRKSVHIGVRLRTDDGWFDATIANVSSRGMMLHSSQPLQRNQFVEIAKGRCVVVGRIVWSQDTTCGLHARDSFDISDLLAKPTERAIVAPRERRAVARPVDHAAMVVRRSEASRLLGRAIEKTALIAAIASVSIIAVGSALEAADAPIEHVRKALGG